MDALVLGNVFSDLFKFETWLWRKSIFGEVPAVDPCDHLRIVVRVKSIELIAGINECTSPEALGALMNLPNCEVRYFTKRFHAKIYVFDRS